jgi:tripartite motif-containing protein 71
VRFSEAEARRERVFDTEDATKGPLSGITRLCDSPRVMKRLQESELKEKRRAREPPKTPPLAFGAKKAQRQASEEDEIAKIKKQNKSAEPSGARAVSAQRRVEEQPAAGRRSSASEVCDSPDPLPTPPEGDAPEGE